MVVKVTVQCDQIFIMNCYVAIVLAFMYSNVHFLSSFMFTSFNEHQQSNSSFDFYVEFNDRI